MPVERAIELGLPCGPGTRHPTRNVDGKMIPAIFSVDQRCPFFKVLRTKFENTTAGESAVVG